MLEDPGDHSRARRSWERWVQTPRGLLRGVKPCSRCLQSLQLPLSRAKSANAAHVGGPGPLPARKSRAARRSNSLLETEPRTSQPAQLTSVRVTRGYSLITRHADEASSPSGEESQVQKL